MNRKALMIAVLALIAVISVGSCSAGWFDFITGEPDLNGQEVSFRKKWSWKVYIVLTFQWNQHSKIR